VHYYLPGYLFLPFGSYDPSDVVKPTRRFIPDGVELVTGEIDKVDPADDVVWLTDGRSLAFDYPVVATGTQPRPDQTPGMLDGGQAPNAASSPLMACRRSRCSTSESAKLGSRPHRDRS